MMGALLSGLRSATFAAGVLSLCILLDGCAVKSRVLPEPLPTTVPDLSWTAAAPDGLSLELDRVIVLNGEGSWVSNANWDEYVLTAKNDSQSAVEIQRFELFSNKLPAPSENSTSREQLEGRSNATLRTMKDVGVIAGSGLVPVGLSAAVVMGSGGILTTGAAAGAAVAGMIVLVPVALVASTVYVVKSHHRANEDRQLIDHNLFERGFAVPLEIDPGAQLQKSAFFPLTPAPSRLVVEYTRAGESRELALELPALVGLHLKPAPAATATLKTATAQN
jgi:hypothetical protein